MVANPNSNTNRLKGGYRMKVIKLYCKNCKNYETCNPERINPNDIYINGFCNIWWVKWCKNKFEWMEKNNER